MTLQDTHLDIAGRELAVDNHVLVCEHNRIILAKVTKLHHGRGSKITARSLNSTAGGRRVEPSTKPLLRNSYNVYLITEPEMLMAILRGAV